MDLSTDQVAAAKAVGCAFFPATELQVQRLTMQQRVFRVAGKPFLLSRDGSYYETIGTLRALIAEVVVVPEPPAAVPPEPAAAAVPVEAPEAPPEPPPEPVPEPAPEAAPEVALESTIEPVRRKRGRPRKVTAAVPITKAAEPEPDSVAAPLPDQPVEPMTPPSRDEGAGRAERLARLARRRAGGPTPNWQTAGPARRGRLRSY